MESLRAVNKGLMAVALVLSLASCGDSKDGQEQAAVEAVAASGLLAYAPAETPYVFTNSRPFPRVITEKLLLNADAELEHAAAELQRAIDTEPFDTAEEKQLMTLVLSLIHI